jgi:hypothetical protein
MKKHSITYLITKSIFVGFFFLSFGLNAQTETVNTLEVKFISHEQYVYYLKIQPQVEQGAFVDDSGIKYLVLSGINSLFDLLKNSEFERSANMKNADKKIVYISTFDESQMFLKTPYIVNYDNKGNYSVIE